MAISFSFMTPIFALQLGGLLALEQLMYLPPFEQNYEEIIISLGV